MRKYILKMIDGVMISACFVFASIFMVSAIGMTYLSIEFLIKKEAEVAMRMVLLFSFTYLSLISVVLINIAGEATAEFISRI